MENDKRCAIRWDIRLPVRYTGIPKNTEGSCHAHDISTTGVRLATVEKYVPGDQLNMMLDIPDSSGRALSVEGNVVWQNESGGSEEEGNYMTGIAFGKVKDSYKKDILSFISSNFPQEFSRRWWEGLK